MTAENDLDRIYRVSTRNPVVRQEEFAILEQLPIALPIGYREYLSRFGRGELSSALRVLAPEQVLEVSRPYNSLEYCPFGYYREWNCGDYPMVAEDLQQSTVFADIDVQRGVYFCAARYGNLLFHINDDFVLRPLHGGILEVVRDSFNDEYFRAFPYFHSWPWADERRRLKKCPINDEVAANAYAVLSRRWPNARLASEQLFVREIEGIVSVLPSRNVPSERAISELEERKRPIRERLRTAKGFEKLEAMTVFAELTQTPIPPSELILQPAAFSFDYDFELEAEVNDFIATIR